MVWRDVRLRTRWAWMSLSRELSPQALTAGSGEGLRIRTGSAAVGTCSRRRPRPRNNEHNFVVELLRYARPYLRSVRSSPQTPITSPLFNKTSLIY